MSDDDYTPTTEEVRTAAHNGAFFPLFRTREELDRWLEARLAEERERCAKVADRYATAPARPVMDAITAKDIAARIRALGNTEGSER